MRDPFRPLRGVRRQGNCGDLADIRRVYKVGVINLIWRHLARPLYADGTVGREAAALRGFVSSASARMANRGF